MTTEDKVQFLTDSSCTFKNLFTGCPQNIPMRYIVVLSGFFLAACNTAGPHFRGLTPTRVVVGGSVFDVRVRGQLAEALRVNPQYAPRIGPIAFRARRAMAQVSGCKVTEVRGDQALALGLLDCGSGPPLLRHAPQNLECEPERGSERYDGDTVYYDLECSPALS